PNVWVSVGNVPVYNGKVCVSVYYGGNRVDSICSDVNYIEDKVKFSYSSNTPYVVVIPPCVDSIEVKCWGGGGGGGGGDAGTGGNGGGGAYVWSKRDVNVADTLLVYVGKGGRAGWTSSGNLYHLTGGDGGWGYGRGGVGGDAGPGGCSGGGGGGGGSSGVVNKSQNIIIGIAGGGGGGGGGGLNSNGTGGGGGGQNGLGGGSGTPGVAGGSPLRHGTNGGNHVGDGAGGGAGGGGYTNGGTGATAASGDNGANGGGGGNSYGDLVIPGNGQNPGNPSDPDLCPNCARGGSGALPCFGVDDCYDGQDGYHGYVVIKYLP
ncbi:MAG: hypothetical protein N2Z72_06960, partial [Bacteroidales bacterium]|nr:hypothetical protein [Bacteroidales bacterium]